MTIIANLSSLASSWWITVAPLHRGVTASCAWRTIQIARSINYKACGVKDTSTDNYLDKMTSIVFWVKKMETIWMLHTCFFKTQYRPRRLYMHAYTYFYYNTHSTPISTFKKPSRHIILRLRKSRKAPCSQWEFFLTLNVHSCWNKFKNKCEHQAMNFDGLEIPLPPKSISNSNP